MTAITKTKPSHGTNHYLCPCSVNIRTNNHFICTAIQYEIRPDLNNNELLRKLTIYTIKTKSNILDNVVTTQPM